VKDGGESLECAVDDVVSRALRDNLTPLQRTSDELHQACADFVAACGSAKPSDALPALLRAQTAASSLASALSVLSNFLLVAIKPIERAAFPAELAGVQAGEKASASTAAQAPRAAAVQNESAWVEQGSQVPGESYTEELRLESASQLHESASDAALSGAGVAEPAATSEPAFDSTGFPPEIQELHRRANRVAKVAMQDIKLLHPDDVQMGREHRDICERLRSEIDKARKEYDRRFRAIQDHPVDYFHRWMVEILAEGKVEALGEYPYPSPVLRH